MPINPLYQFIEPGAADIDDRNKVLNFLQQDAQRKGMPLNYQRELGAAQEQMNVLDQARPQLNMGPAPRAVPPRPRPQVPMQQIRGAQLPMSPMGAAPELQSPVAPEPKNIQGISGLASQEEVPMTMPGQFGGKIEVPPPAPIANQPMEELPSAQVTAIPKGFEQTTMAQMGQKAGWDPRALYAAMAQFSGEFGNLYGKATPSSAQPYYEQMMDAEQKAQAAAQKAREAALDRSQREREMEMRYAPKTVGPEAELKMELVRVQTDALKNKLRVDQEMNDPESERSKALKFGLEKYVQKTMNIPQFKAHPNLTGADVYKWLGSMQFAAGQQNLMMREQLGAIGSAESKANDRAWREQEAKRQRDWQSEQNALNRAAAQQRQQTAIAAKPVKPTKPVGADVPTDQVLIPGYVRTQNVPVRDPELSKARAVIGQVKPMEDDISQLQSMIKQYGSFENPYSEAGRRMQSLARAIQLKLKSEAFLQLGVLAGPDLTLLETQIPDTGSIKNVGQADAFIKQLEDVKRRLRGGVDEQMRMIGFERERGTTQSQQPQQIGPRGRTLWKP